MIFELKTIINNKSFRAIIIICYRLKASNWKLRSIFNLEFCVNNLDWRQLQPNSVNIRNNEQ